MAGTILSLIFAACFGINALETGFQPPFGSPLFLVVGLVMLAGALVATASIWRSIIKVQMKVMAAGQELYMKDRALKTALLALFGFTLFSAYLSFVHDAMHVWFYLWLVAFGAAFDLVRFYYVRSFQYTSMPFLVELARDDLEHAVKNKDEAKAFEWLEVAVDSAFKACQKKQVRLATQALGAVQTFMQTYVQAVSQAQVMQSFQQNGSGLTFLDKVNSLCIFVSERLLWVFEEAVKHNARPICETIIAEFGKMAVFFAKHNPKVATLSISFLTKCGEIAKEASCEELLIRTSLTLSETTKRLLAYTKERNESFKDLVMTAIGSLELTVKSLYKQNRDVNVVLLMQPFAEIGEFVGQDQMRDFPDRDDVLKEIRRVLTEFQALQVIAKNVETIAPHVAEDSSSTYQQDMPFGV